MNTPDKDQRQEEPQLKEKIRLKTFIEENQRFIAIIGVFGALSAFFRSLNNEIAVIAAASSFAIFLLLCWELWISFPKNNQASLSLQLFEILFVFLVLNIGFYVLTTFFVITFLFLFFVILYIEGKIISKYNLINLIRNLADKASARYQRFDRIIQAISALLILSLVFLLAIVASNIASRVARFLEQFKP